MMKLYAVVDKKAKAIVSVFPSQSNESAERSFLMLLSGPRNLYTDFPEDFSLFAVADVNFDKGNLVVSVPDTDILLQNGFSAGVIHKCAEPIKDGSDYGRIYLDSLRAQRFPELNEDIGYVPDKKEDLIDA